MQVQSYKPVRYFKKKEKKSLKLIAPSRIREMDYYLGRELVTQIPVDFTLGISTIGNFFTDFAGSHIVNFVTILGNSPSFTQMNQLWGKYKIMNLSVTMTPTDNLAGYNLTLSSNCPYIACGCFPSCVGLPLGPLIKDNDNSFVFSGGLNYSQGRQWNFPDNMLNDKNQGVGTWNNSLDYTGQIGQIAFLSLVPTIAISSPRIVASVRARFTVKWGLYSLN